MYLLHLTLFSVSFFSFLLFPPSDLSRKQRFRWGSSHRFWSTSVWPLPPCPPAGLDQRHCAASGSPGLWHTAGTLTVLAKPIDTIQQHFSSIMYPGVIVICYIIHVSCYILSQVTSYVINDILYYIYYVFVEEKQFLLWPHLCLIFFFYIIWWSMWSFHVNRKKIAATSELHNICFFPLHCTAMLTKEQTFWK